MIDNEMTFFTAAYCSNQNKDYIRDSGLVATVIKQKEAT